MEIADYLARCPRCHQVALLVYGEASYRNLALFEPIPWSPLDERPDRELTDHQHRQWERQLPYKLAICYLNFDRGTWQLAMCRSNEKLRPGKSLWKPHNCLMEESDGMEPKEADLIPDLPALARDGGTQRGVVASGHHRHRNPRIGRAGTGGV